MQAPPAPARRTQREGRQTNLVWALVIGAFGLRLIVRYFKGVPDPVNGGYYIFLLIAQTFARGQGLCMSPGHNCAIRGPIYSLLVWLFLRNDAPGPGLIVAQAAIGALVVWFTWRLGRLLFDERVGTLAAVVAAVSPYTVVHDTALQDTVPVNALAVAAVVLLLAADRGRSAPRALAAGVALALLVLTSIRMTLLVPAEIGWVALAGRGTSRERWQRAALVALPGMILIGGWMARNATIVGVPVLTTVSGDHLWVANSASTLSRFPIESIDRSRDVSLDRLTPAQSQALDRVRDDEVATDRLFAEWGRQYIRAHPFQIARNAVIKIGVPVFAFYSPVRTALVQVGFMAIYLPIHVAAIVAAWRLRRAWRAQLLVYLFVAAFLLTTAVYWAHTSHSTWLDPFWFVYAAAAVLGADMRHDAGATITGDHA